MMWTIIGGENVVLRNCYGPADIRGGTVEVCDIRDKCVVKARRAVIRGNTVTHDCTIHVTESLTFTTSEMLGLSDDCIVSWPGNSTKLGRLKSYRISRLPEHQSMSGTMVGNGFEITAKMLDFVMARRAWNPLSRN